MEDTYQWTSLAISVGLQLRNSQEIKHTPNQFDMTVPSKPKPTISVKMGTSKKSLTRCEDILLISEKSLT